MSNLELKQNLNEKQLVIVQSELESNKKSTAVAYLLWFFLGGLGIHRFYIGKTGSAITMLALFVSGWVLSIIYIGFILLIGLYIWVFIDAFLLHGAVKRINLKLERNILRRVANT